MIIMTQRQQYFKGPWTIIFITIILILIIIIITLIYYYYYYYTTTAILQWCMDTFFRLFSKL